MNEAIQNVSNYLLESCILEDLNDEKTSQAIEIMYGKPEIKSRSTRATEEKLLTLAGVRDEILSALEVRRSSMLSNQSSRRNFRAQVQEDNDARDKEIGMLASLTRNIISFQTDLSEPFKSAFEPKDMRCLALVAHNHMKPAMLDFIETHSQILKKFQLTGTNTTMSMCRSVFGDDPLVVYGPTCTSGPLGGDAQLCALMCLENIGAVIFFMDPLSAHPHQADIDSLIRICNVYNVALCSNPTTGCAMMFMLRQALVTGKREMIPSFFETLESPAVEAYKNNQDAALKKVVDKKKASQQ